MFSTKDKDRVLRYLLKNRDPLHDDFFKPTHLLDRFKGISSGACWDILRVLDYEGLISMEASVDPVRGVDIQLITLNVAGIGHFSIKKEDRKQVFKAWPINIFVALASAILGAFFARISLLLWP